MKIVLGAGAPCRREIGGVGENTGERVAERGSASGAECGNKGDTEGQKFLAGRSQQRSCEATTTPRGNKSLGRRRRRNSRGSPALGAISQVIPRSTTRHQNNGTQATTHPQPTQISTALTGTEGLDRKGGEETKKEGEREQQRVRYAVR